MEKIRNIPSLYPQKEDCCGCRACENACPKDAIKFEQDDFGFFYPKIDTEKCVQCMRCKDVCDFQNEKVKRQYPKECYAASNNNFEILKNSTSGGAFTALAKAVIDKGGVVFGCILNKDMAPVHVLADSIDKISPMRGSKYVQSNVGLTYREVKKYLLNNVYVLYTGTPCQIAGLYSYLGKTDCDKLITVEFICHGVPSPGMFKAYIDYLEQKNKEKITEFYFRSKKRGWGTAYSFQQHFKCESGKIYKVDYNSAYMVNFRKNNFHRSSCFKCKYANPERTADFTIGDFWKWYAVDVKLKPNKGLSILLLNTDKAKSFLPDLEKNMELEPVERVDLALKTNGNLVRPSKMGAHWSDYMCAYKNGHILKMFDEFERRHNGKIALKIINCLPISVIAFLKKLQLKVKGMSKESQNET